MPHTRTRAATAALMLATAAGAACERRPGAEDGQALLTLMVETPEALTWGSTGVLRLSLANEGETPADGAMVEVFVPDWLEFGTVEPAGLAVTVASMDGETRLVYAFADSLQPGQRLTVRQHLRVQPQAPLPPAANDTVDTVAIAPLNQTVRARLLSLEGAPVGAEVQATLNFVTEFPRPPGLPPLPRDTLPPRDTLAPRDTLPPRDTVPGR